MLVDYLHELRGTAKPAPLAPKLAEAVIDPGHAVTEHVNNLLARVPAATTAGNP